MNPEITLRVTYETFTHTSTLAWPMPRCVACFVSDWKNNERPCILQTIDVSDSPAGVKITTRKPKASLHAVASAKAVSYIRPRSGTRRALGIASQSAKKGYRPDLRTVRSSSL